MDQHFHHEFFLLFLQDLQSSLRAEQEAELAENADFLAKSAIRQIEARNKRALLAKSAESLRQTTAIVASFLRDVLATCAQTPDLVINVDVRSSIDDVAARKHVMAEAKPHHYDELAAPPMDELYKIRKNYNDSWCSMDAGVGGKNHYQTGAAAP